MLATLLQALYCTIVLSGRLKITAGAEAFTSEAGAFSVLAADALTAPTEEPYSALSIVVDTTNEFSALCGLSCCGCCMYVFEYD